MSDPESRRALLDAALADPATGLDGVSGLPAAELDTALRELVRDRGATALPLVTALAERGTGPTRRVARRVLYRLAQAGIAPPERQTRSVIARRPDRPIRAWMSGIDGSGSQAAWILFEGGYGGLSLCSVIVNDTEGLLEAAGGEISKKRLAAELAELRASQNLPWVEVPPEHVIARVVDALAIHAERHTSPPEGFARWLRFFVASPEDDGTGLSAPTADTGAATRPAGDARPDDPSLAERALQLFELPELAGWFLDPGSVQGDALKLLEARSSRLIVSDQIKAEREASIVTQVVERELAGDARRRWANRLAEMALIFELTERPEPAALARAAAGQLLDLTRAVEYISFARALAERALEIASEVASGRLSASEVSRQPRERAP